MRERMRRKEAHRLALLALGPHGPISRLLLLHRLLHPAEVCILLVSFLATSGPTARELRAHRL